MPYNTLNAAQNDVNHLAHYLKHPKHGRERPPTQVVQPFCFWGPPTLQSVTDLLYKKAFLKAEDKEDGPVPHPQLPRPTRKQSAEGGMI